MAVTFDPSLWASRAAFVVVMVLLLWLIVDVTLINKCEDSKKTTKKKLFWITMTLGVMVGAYGLVRTGRYAQSLQKSNNVARNAAAKASGASQAAQAAQA